ncbi:hypothetical protein OF83DRAFT_1253728 [Amylostereum chailletii]|nr:hypothetical protein OF83DRAFT_1253728 [Amylostereum chailletii]
MRLLCDRKTADVPKNALLLRADVHSYFDDYQIGIFEGIIYKFEKDGAPSVTDTCDKLLPAKSYRPPKAATLAATARYPDQKELEIEEALLNFHFRTCLLWHVAGGGRPAETNAIFPNTL